MTTKLLGLIRLSCWNEVPENLCPQETSIDSVRVMARPCSLLVLLAMVAGFICLCLIAMLATVITMVSTRIAWWLMSKAKSRRYSLWAEPAAMHNNLMTRITSMCMHDVHTSISHNVMCFIFQVGFWPLMDGIASEYISAIAIDNGLLELHLGGDPSQRTTSSNSGAVESVCQTPYLVCFPPYHCAINDLATNRSFYPVLQHLESGYGNQWRNPTRLLLGPSVMGKLIAVPLCTKYFQFKTCFKCTSDQIVQGAQRSGA